MFGIDITKKCRKCGYEVVDRGVATSFKFPNDDKEYFVHSNVTCPNCDEKDIFREEMEELHKYKSVQPISACCW